MNQLHRGPIRRRIAVIGLLSCVGLLSFAPSAGAAEEVTICHATGSETTPYLEMAVSSDTLELHRSHQNGGDIVPAPSSGCPTEVVPPPPVDVCPNIAGNQATVPVDFLIDAAGNCVAVPVVGVDCVVGVGVTQTATTVTGTAAHDTIDCGGASPGKTIDGRDGNDTITSTRFDDVLTGGPGNDTMTSLGGFDVLSGNEGNDTISAGADDDFVTGSDGNDTLSGEAGNDFVDGGNDDDTLSGGTGVNTLIGGPGTDVCDGVPCAV